MQKIQRFFTERKTSFQRQSCFGKVLLVTINLIILCFLSVVLIAIFSPSTLVPEVNDTSTVKIEPSLVITQTERPTEIPATIAPTVAFTPTITLTPTHKVKNTATPTIVETVKPTDIPPQKGNGSAPFFLFVFAFFIFIISAFAYLLPSVIAYTRHHHNADAIFALNLLLGWTFLGWVVALVWSLTSTK